MFRQLMQKLAPYLLLVGMALTVFHVEARESLTPAQAAELLTPSVFGFGIIGQRGSFCTATKIGPRHYLTALHCAVDLETDYKLESSHGEYAFVQSVLASTVEKNGRGKWREDWAILIASSENRAPSLNLGCGDTHYIGEPVAYMGFPEGLERAFGVGYVSTTTGYRNNSDIFVDLPAAPGASGSAVISLDTGQIMGILTEGVLNSRTREFYMIGLESIENTDPCKEWSRAIKTWEEIGDDDLFIPPENGEPKKADPSEDWT